jgi:hypothetical protein
MRVDAEPWKEVLPRSCKVVGADPGPAGTGALVGLVLIALAVMALDRKVPR